MPHLILYFFLWEIDFACHKANIEDPEEASHSITFFLGISCFQKVPLSGVSVSRGLINYPIVIRPSTVYTYDATYNLQQTTFSNLSIFQK